MVRISGQSASASTPDILILGQITLDHVVPARPGPWRELLGGNALYAAAGARLWCDPARIGIVARRGPNLPACLDGTLSAAGLTAAGLVPVAVENMVEWLLYETDGSRRNLPRDPALRDPRLDPATRKARYIARKVAVSASHGDIPPHWLPATAIHLAPQMEARHRASVAALAGRARLLSVDPSPLYSRGATVKALASLLRGADALLPSEGEVGHLAPDGDWPGVARALVAAGFAETAIKRGASGAVVHHRAAAAPAVLPAAPAAPRDTTGAGDAFCGAYLACRARGLPPPDAARRAAVAGAMVTECAGAAAALALEPAEARRRLDAALTAAGAESEKAGARTCHAS